jgi:hypothetical protein
MEGALDPLRSGALVLEKVELTAEEEDEDGSWADRDRAPAKNSPRSGAKRKPPRQGVRSPPPAPRNGLGMRIFRAATGVNRDSTACGE